MNDIRQTEAQMHYFAHIAEDRQQTVEEHLTGTAELSAGFAQAFGAREQGRFIGLAHDIVDHATAGAWECAKLDAFWASACVAGHHGGLPDFGNLNNDMPDEPTLFGRLKRAMGGGVPPYSVPIPLPAPVLPKGYGKNFLTDSFLIRMLYSCLVDADYLDTERFMSNRSVERGTGEALPALLDKLNRYIGEIGLLKPVTELNRHRAEVLRACIDSGVRDKGLYTLTVPAGGGKTLASMAFALNHAVKHGMERVIYVIPYTSIIEQTADVFRGIFGEENVVEHHANADCEVVESGDAAKYRLVRAT